MTSSRIILPILGVAVWSGFCFWAGLSSAREPAATAAVLLSTSQTIIGQPISYPTETPANVTAAIITMPPGAKTGWHVHEVPLFAYMLEGTLKVDYGAQGQRVYNKGDSFIEAIRQPHNGENMGPEPVKVLAVFIGADGLKNTVKIKPPQSP